MMTQGRWRLSDDDAVMIFQRCWLSNVSSLSMTERCFTIFHCVLTQTTQSHMLWQIIVYPFQNSSRTVDSKHKVGPVATWWREVFMPASGFETSGLWWTGRRGRSGDEGTRNGLRSEMWAPTVLHLFLPLYSSRGNVVRLAKRIFRTRKK